MTEDVGIQLSGADSLWTQTAPLLYTSNPWTLLVADVKLAFKNAWSLPYIVWPFTPFNSGPLDELYPSWPNLWSISLHAVFIVLQLAFLISIPATLILPAPFNLTVLYIATFIIANYYVWTLLLNGTQAQLHSKVDLSEFDQHEDEQWIFLNGVAVGKHWMQCNLDRIALSFRRPVEGIHNPTCGIIFDVLQCLIERDFRYVTPDVRAAYPTLKKAIGDPKKKKVVFILHSQGGIQGGLILDGLLADVPTHLLRKLEVYTFGCAANHFNNPQRSLAAEGNGQSQDGGPDQDKQEAVRNIEHYANELELVSRWGVLHFDSWETKEGKHNRYRGTVFQRYGGKGHLFCQHYLDPMFPMVDASQPAKGIREENDFMSAIAKVRVGPGDEPSAAKRVHADMQGTIPDDTRQQEPTSAGKRQVMASVPSLPSFDKQAERVENLSRLWRYRNGQSPAEDD